MGGNEAGIMQKGFTLMEVLVAGAILAVALIVAFVVFQKNQGDALNIASSRNLQQWGIALNLYLIDNQNELPETGRDPVTPEQKKAWFNALPPYVSQTPLASLPPGERPRPGLPSFWIDPATKPVKAWDPDVFFFNYGMNKNLQPVAGTRSFRIYEISRPANVIFLTEQEGYIPAIGPEEVVFRHGPQGMLNPKALAHVLFCDGHMQLMSRAVLVNDPATLEAATAETGVSWFQK